MSNPSESTSQAGILAAQAPKRVKELESLAGVVTCNPVFLALADNWDLFSSKTWDTDEPMKGYTRGLWDLTAVLRKREAGRTYYDDPVLSSAGPALGAVMTNRSPPKGRSGGPVTDAMRPYLLLDRLIMTRRTDLPCKTTPESLVELVPSDMYQRLNETFHKTFDKSMITVAQYHAAIFGGDKQQERIEANGTLLADEGAEDVETPLEAIDADDGKELWDKLFRWSLLSQKQSESSIAITRLLQMTIAVRYTISHHFDSKEMDDAALRLYDQFADLNPLPGISKEVVKEILESGTAWLNMTLTTSVQDALLFHWNRVPPPAVLISVGLRTRACPSTSKEFWAMEKILWRYLFRVAGFCRVAPLGRYLDQEVAKIGGYEAVRRSSECKLWTVPPFVPKKNKLLEGEKGVGKGRKSKRGEGDDGNGDAPHQKRHCSSASEPQDGELVMDQGKDDTRARKRLRNSSSDREEGECLTHSEEEGEPPQKRLCNSIEEQGPDRPPGLPQLQAVSPNSNDVQSPLSLEHSSSTPPAFTPVISASGSTLQLRISPALEMSPSSGADLFDLDLDLSQITYDDQREWSTSFSSLCFNPDNDGSGHGGGEKAIGGDETPQSPIDKDGLGHSEFNDGEGTHKAQKPTVHAQRKQTFDPRESQASDSDSGSDSNSTSDSDSEPYKHRPSQSQRPASSPASSPLVLTESEEELQSHKTKWHTSSQRRQNALKARFSSVPPLGSSKSSRSQDINKAVTLGRSEAGGVAEHPESRRPAAGQRHAKVRGGTSEPPISSGKTSRHASVGRFASPASSEDDGEDERTETSNPAKGTGKEASEALPSSARLSRGSKASVLKQSGQDGESGGRDVAGRKHRDVSGKVEYGEGRVWNGRRKVPAIKTEGDDPFFLTGTYDAPFDVDAFWAQGPVWGHERILEIIEQPSDLKINDITFKRPGGDDVVITTWNEPDYEQLKVLAASVNEPNHTLANELLKVYTSLEEYEAADLGTLFQEHEHRCIHIKADCQSVSVEVLENILGTRTRCYVQDLWFRHPPDDNSPMSVGTFDKIHEISKAQGTRPVNALNNPSGQVPLALPRLKELSFRDSLWQNCRIVDYPRYDESIPMNDFRWTLLSTRTSYSAPHIDANGMCTVVNSLTCTKLWWVGKREDFDVPKLNALDDFGPYLIPMKQYKWVPVWLEPGDILIMRPGTVHAVLTIEPGYTVGEHFWSMATLERSLYSLYHTISAHRFLTNASHDVAVFKTLCRLMRCWAINLKELGAEKEIPELNFTSTTDIKCLVMVGTYLQLCLHVNFSGEELTARDTEQLLAAADNYLYLCDHLVSNYSATGLRFPEGSTSYDWPDASRPQKRTRKNASARRNKKLSNGSSGPGNDIAVRNEELRERLIRNGEMWLVAQLWVRYQEESEVFEEDEDIPEQFKEFVDHSFGFFKVKKGWFSKLTNWFRKKKDDVKENYNASSFDGWVCWDTTKIQAISDLAKAAEVEGDEVNAVGAEGDDPSASP